MSIVKAVNNPLRRIEDIRNIWAVGRNYEDHAKELGNLPPAANGEPMIFLKAGSCAVGPDGRFRLPSFTSDVHHEVELALQFGDDLDFVALTVGIDLTAREVQSKLKAAGHPWTLAKSFRDACLLGPLMPLPANFDGAKLEFALKVNGEPRQRGRSRDMIHSIEKLRGYLIERFPVVPGDIVMTGTPSGVAPVRRGDILSAEIFEDFGDGPKTRHGLLLSTGWTAES